MHLLQLRVNYYRGLQRNGCGAPPGPVTGNGGSVSWATLSRHPVGPAGIDGSELAGTLGVESFMTWASSD